MEYLTQRVFPPPDVRVRNHGVVGVVIVAEFQVEGEKDIGEGWPLGMPLHQIKKGCFK